MVAACKSKPNLSKLTKCGSQNDPLLRPGPQQNRARGNRGVVNHWFQRFHCEDWLLFFSPCVWPIQLASRKPHLVKTQLPSHSEVLSQIWCVTKYVNYVAWLTSKTSRFPLISGEKCTWVVLTRQDVYRCGHAASYIVHKSVLSKTSPHAKPMCLICNECVKKYSEGR